MTKLAYKKVVDDSFVSGWNCHENSSLEMILYRRVPL